MRYLAVLLPLLALSACSPTAWGKEGGTQAEFLRDKYECNRDSMQVNAAGLWRMAFFEECMESKGYYKKSDSENSTGIFSKNAL